MKADLHVHSHYSDGSDSLEKVIKQGVRNGLTHLSFVDHDTVDGLQESLTLGREYGIEIIPGIEISAYDFKRNRKVHILGYNYHPKGSHIRALCQALLKRRQEHSLWQIRQIQTLGYQLEEENIMESAKPSHTIYKQHIMGHLTNADYDSPPYRELYQKLFKNNGIAAGDIEYVDVFDAVSAIKADDGMAVVAHPGQLDSYDLIPELVKIGLDGVERNHPDHTRKDFHMVETLAERYGLVMTGGTDYHGSFGTPVEIGSITSPLNVMLSECK
ncbi:PHP domain-containing protein [Oceanobacillus senegalensis]|uniref:PHP domain-containing protein n=1 Tax=Oceanobacillus senegalensis TaxID=1936063 RepID=UPI000A304B29|nr:PHP domain-containing protein [Oceanobacillus senegalensis]